MTDGYILVLATGGTIAGLSGSAVQRAYEPGQVGINSMIDAVRSLGVEAAVKGRQLANIGSESIGPQLWHKIHAAIMDAIADEACQGVVLTHGTDTAEETAFLLDQTLPTTKPVVVVGAMRPADAVGSDGLRNFANAILVAGDWQSAGRGVLVVMGDAVFAARDVRKSRTSGVEAFRGFPRGPIATVTPSTLEWFGAPWRPDETARFPIPHEFPRVSVFYAVAGIGAEDAEAVLSRKPDGVVIAGFGEGTMPGTVQEVFARAAAQGTLVVRASRVDEGLVERNDEDDADGFIAARALNPQKARILLQLLVAAGVRDPQQCQAAFGRR